MNRCTKIKNPAAETSTAYLLKKYINQNPISTNETGWSSLSNTIYANLCDVCDVCSTFECL